MKSRACSRTLPLLVCGVLSCLLSSPVRAGDWTSYLNGNDRAGVSNAQLSPTLELAWTYQSQAKPEKAWSGSRTAPIEGHIMLPRVTFDASPQMVLAEGKAYFGSTVDHRMHCVDAATGKPVWSFYTDGPIRLAPTYAHGNVYFGSDDGKVYCLNAADGQVRWQMRVGPKDDRLLSRGEMISRWPVRTGVLIDDKTAYFGAGVFPHETVYLVAANALTGEIIWYNDRISQTDAGRNDLSPQGYLLCSDENLYVPSGRSLPVAVSKKTGDIVFQRKHSWRTDAGGVVGGTKAVLGDGQVYAGGPHHFLAMDQKTGDVGAAFIGGRLMVLGGENAYLLDGTKVFCVDRDEHARASQEKQEWFLRSRDLRKEPEKLAEAEKKIREYAGVGIIWEFPSEADGALIATERLVIVGGKDKVFALDRKSGKKVWEQVVQGNAMGLAANDTTLTVSTDEGWIYAYSNSAPAKPKQWPEPYTSAYFDDNAAEFYKSAAKEILDTTQQRSGYCLVAGSETGQLAYQLAKQSSLMIIAVEPDAQKAQASRTALQQAGIHATRVTVVHQALDDMPFANYFANLIVSETQLLTGKIPCKPESVARFLKPCGGAAILGQPSDVVRKVDVSQEEGTQWLTQIFRIDEGELTNQRAWTVFRRGKLPGAGSWTHQYGNAANTSFTNDLRVRDGLGVLWYGDPGPSAMINRHEAAGAPLSTNGRMFIQGTDSIMAYDAYNGNFLWEFKNPGAIRTGVFNNRETHNLAATDDLLYMAIESTCKAVDTATGQVVREYTTPKSPDGIDRAWAYVAADQNQLFGTSTIRKELEERMRRRGLTVSSQTDAIFAFDTTTGKQQWIYRGENILHTTICLSPDHVFFIDSAITPEQRQELYQRDKGALKDLTGDAALKAEEEMKALDARRAVALDRKTGAKIWEKPVNVTDTTNVSAGGGSLTAMFADGYLVLCGANANGHYWKQFLAGEFDKRKLVVLDAKNGEEIWSKNANYMNRPLVVEGKVYAEPWAFELKSGEVTKRPHPLTGEDSQWRFSRPG
ncbi:MAG: PQQ-binding-like beta-propeller repeat protein, partial [Pirellulaceae bacterium]|nr:PQQ-binding-like beta-propeller repeat protein [Pirellulaceae bacterium]